MTKLDKAKKAHLEARKQKNVIVINLLGVLIGQVESDMKDSAEGEDALVESTAKKMYKSLEENQKAVEENSRSMYGVEMKILEPYLPQTMSQDEIKAELDKIGLDKMDSFGAKMGAAMSALKGKADGNDVKAVIQANYI